MDNASTTQDQASAVETVYGLDRFLPLEGDNAGFGAALYIGSKSINGRLYDLSTGELVAFTTASGDYASFSGLEIKELMTDVFETLSSSAGIALSKIKVAVVSGSTLMESRASGVSHDALVHDDGAGSDNFGCDVEYMLAGSSSIAVGEAFFVPCLDAEVGGDFLCSLLAIDVLGSEDPVLFISAGAEGSSRATIAYGNSEALSVAVLSEDCDVESGLRRLLDLCDAEQGRISQALIAGDISFTVPQELVGHLRRIEYPAIVGASAVLLSEDAEDELCSIVSECRFVRL